MEFVTHLRCVECGATYAPVPDAATCPVCGISGILEAQYDYDRLARRWDRSTLAHNPDPSHWRYRPLIPVEPATPVPNLRTGNTPLLSAPRVAQSLSIRQVWLKDEGANPTGSLKDRASSVAVMKALEAGAGVVACASTGNAASSLAGQAASVGLTSVIFVPHYAAQGKVAQLRIYGANVLSVQGSYVQAYDLCQEAVGRYGWFNRNCAVNPYLVEGKKTAALEAAEQLGWQVPDWVVVPTGDGCTIAGIYKGFYDLLQLGWIPRVPRLLSVQAEGSRAIYEFAHTGVLKEAGEDTIADGIAVGVPRNARKAVRAVEASGGAYALVSDAEIREAMRWLGRLTGLFGEPSAAAGIAGLRKAVAGGVIERDQSVLCLITGNGLKDVKNAIAAAGDPVKVEPRLAEVAAALPPELLDQERSGRA